MVSDVTTRWCRTPRSCVQLTKAKNSNQQIVATSKSCGLGTMKAAADAGIWAIGVDSDQSFLGPHVLTSVLKSFEAGFVDVFARVKTGKLGTGRDTTLTMRDGAAGLGRISRRVPRSLVTQLRGLERQIAIGKLRVSAPRPGNEG